MIELNQILDANITNLGIEAWNSDTCTHINFSIGIHKSQIWPGKLLGNTPVSLGVYIFEAVSRPLAINNISDYVPIEI